VPTAPPPDTFAGRVRSALTQRGWTVYRLAAAARLQRTHAGRIVAGDTVPSWPVACRIADALGVPVGELRGQQD
jgi:transcriptional regulator with XRE-family HTH domain